MGAGVEMGVGVGAEIALMVVLGAVMGLVVEFGSEELSEAEQAVVVAPDWEVWGAPVVVVVGLVWGAGCDSAPRPAEVLVWGE